MPDKNSFIQLITEGYTFKGDSITLGGAVLNGECLTNTLVKAPLKTFNRHGLIAGATGSGKTKTMQGIAEALSQKGVSSLLMDVKGDLSGLTKPATANPKIDERHAKIGTPWKAVQFSVELLTISKQNGVRMRATVSEFGPVLFSKILELNDTQEGVVSLVFKYCDDKQLPLLDLKDFKKTLQFLTNEGKEEIKSEYGAIATATTSTIIRKIIEIEQQGAEVFFGEKSFDVEDFMRVDDNGLGALNIIRLTDIQDKPKLFSTFMLSLLAEVYSTFPEVGDADAPKLMIFIDEAHLIFNTATKNLLNQIETIIKLIRSKGVGVFFVTQSPEDIPASVLGQLGMKVPEYIYNIHSKKVFDTYIECIEKRQNQIYSYCISSILLYPYFRHDYNRTLGHFIVYTLSANLTFSFVALKAYVQYKNIQREFFFLFLLFIKCFVGIVDDRRCIYLLLYHY